MNPRSFPKIFYVLAVAIALLFPAPPAAAQAISGDLLGTVVDATGAAVPNVSVTATNVGTNISTTAISSGNGEYRFTNLPAGTYSVTAKASGFTAATLKNVSINLNQTATANFTLQVGAVSSSVEVVEAPAAIDTTTAQVQNTFTTKQAEDLPTSSIGSGILNLSLLGSGVASSGGVGIGTGPSVGGQRPRNNNFTIEGVDNNSKSVTGPEVTIPNDAVQEFTLLSNQFSAEYGHSSGGQFNTIVKSGTNQFHGELYEYARNRNLDALDQSFANQGLTSVPRFDENRLGANVGGPIIKNKWFFFSDFEYNPLGQASVSGGIAYAPTAAGYSTLSGIPGINQTNLGVLEKYASAPLVASGSQVPSITVGGVSIPVGEVNTVGPNYTNSYFGVFSSDYNISDKDQLRGRFVYNRSDGINTGAQLPAFYTTAPTTNYLATLAEYHTFTPNVAQRTAAGLQPAEPGLSGGQSKLSRLGSISQSPIQRSGAANWSEPQLSPVQCEQSLPGRGQRHLEKGRPHLQVWYGATKVHCSQFLHATFARGLRVQQPGDLSLRPDSGLHSATRNRELHILWRPDRDLFVCARRMAHAAEFDHHPWPAIRAHDRSLLGEATGPERNLERTGSH